MASERLNAAIAEMAKQDITFANCDSTWQKRVMTAVLAAADTRPASSATDTGLETEPMRIEVCKGSAGLAIYVNDGRICGPRHNGWMETILSGTVDAATRSQAEELLAAERANTETALEQRNMTIAELARLEADNAAQAARIKELDAAWLSAEKQCQSQGEQLAAAEKALEGLREKGRKVLDVLKAWEDDSDLVNSGKIVSDFRAVLGGKPS